MKNGERQQKCTFIVSFSAHVSLHTLIHIKRQILCFISMLIMCSHSLCAAEIITKPRQEQFVQWHTMRAHTHTEKLNIRFILWDIVLC